MSHKSVSWPIVCLKNKKETKKKYALIPLLSGKEISVGRGLDVTVQLLSRKNPLILSRKHVIFKENGQGNWTIVDNKSLNGVFLNGKKLDPLEPHVVNDGDIIQIGDVGNKKSEVEFLFEVTSKRLNLEQATKILHSLRPKGSQKQKKPNEGSIPDSLPSQDNGEHGRESSDKHFKRKRETTVNISEEDKPGTSTESSAKKSRMELLNSKSKMSSGEMERLGLTEEHTKLIKELLLQKGDRTVQELVELLKKKEISFTEKKKEEEMLTKLQEKEQRLKEMVSEMKKMEEAVQAKESALMEQLKKQREELISERQQVESSLQENLAKKLAEKDENFRKEQEDLKLKLENSIRAKEKEMLSELESQKEALLKEKQKVEINLQQEMARKLEEKDKALQERLEEEKSRLEDVINQKEEEYVALQVEVEENQKVKEQEEKASIQKAKKEAIEKFADVLETELQCSICTELFIQATTLNCSHSFCSYCITSWMKRKKECPVCRQRIKSYNPSIVLDNYIDKVVERLESDVRKRRLDMIEERKRDVAKNPIKEPIVLSNNADDDDDDDEDDDDDDMNDTDSSDIYVSDNSYDEGIPGAYYGGHGHCFNCGRRGHWANGCPYI